MPDIQPPPQMGDLIQQLAQQFTSIMTTALTTIDSTVVDLARLAYVTVLMVGVLLYFTHVERRLGKDLIKGGVALAILSEFVFLSSRSSEPVPQQGHDPPERGDLLPEFQ